MFVCVIKCNKRKKYLKLPKNPELRDSWVKIICVYTSLAEIEPAQDICISPVHMEGSLSQRAALSLILKEGQREEVEGGALL